MLQLRDLYFAASSSTYGDVESELRVENKIGKPLSNYAVTKYVNELYADVFSSCYNMECIGLRYFNVFGPKQDPHGSSAAVIPLWIKDLINHTSPCINGDGEISRDFTYIDNVISANQKTMLLDSKILNKNKKHFLKYLILVVVVQLLYLNCLITLEKFYQNLIVKL